MRHIAISFSGKSLCLIHTCHDIGSCATCTVAAAAALRSAIDATTQLTASSTLNHDWNRFQFKKRPKSLQPHPSGPPVGLHWNTLLLERRNMAESSSTTVPSSLQLRPYLTAAATPHPKINRLEVERRLEDARCVAATATCTKFGF